MPVRLRPTAPVAADAILVGDPGRALLLAQELLVQPKMSNHARGLWGYWGETPQGGELSVHSTGMGGPSAALVLADLAELGLRRAVRVGTCTGLTARAALGKLLVVGDARPAAAAAAAAPDPGLSDELERRLPRAAAGAALLSLDAPYRGADEPVDKADAADMQTAALLGQARRLGLRLAAVLVVAEREGLALGDPALAEAAKRAGAAAAAALASRSGRPRPPETNPQPKVEG